MPSESDNDLPDDVVELGRLTIKVYMGPNGRGTGFTIDSLTPEEAIGHVTVVLDRLREDRAMAWSDLQQYACVCPDECPNCGLDFTELDDDEDEDD